MDLSEQISLVNLNSESPLSVDNFAAVIAGQHTEVIICYFSNNTSYFITQFGKIGNIYAVETEEVQNGILANERVYNLRTLLGGDNTEIEAGVRFIAGQLDVKQPLTISLTLKSYSPEHLKLILKCIKEFKAH